MIQTTTTSVSYTCNGTANTFAIPFMFYSAEHLYITLVRNTEPGDENQYDHSSYGAVWTATGEGDADGGELTLVAETPVAGSSLRIDRIVPEVQLTNYVNNARFDAEAHEKQMDLIVMMIQQKISRELPTLG
jgi:hypothetical protein